MNGFVFLFRIFRRKNKVFALYFGAKTLFFWVVRG